MATVRSKLPEFIKYCRDLNITFASDAYESEEEWQKLWFNFYGEELKMTQVIAHMRIASVKYPKEFIWIKWEKYQRLTDQEFEKLVLYFFENNFDPINNLDGHKEIKTICLQLFHKHVSIYDTTFLRYNDNYDCLPHYLLWERSIDIFAIRNDIRNIRILKVIEYCENNSIFIMPGADGLKQIDNIWREIFHYRIYKQRIQEQKRYLKKAASHLVMTHKDLYIFFIEHCKNKLINIQSGKDGYIQVKKLWQQLFDIECSLSQAQERYKQLKKLAPLLFKHQAPIKKFVSFKNIYTISQVERDEQLNLFGEFCTVHNYVFSDTDKDLIKLEQLWDYFFEIKE
jgi:hypothetical protein